MNKIMVIARREYLANVRTRAFIISLVLMPIFMGGGAMAQKLLEGRVDLRARTFLVFDRTGKLFEAIRTQAELHNRYEIYDEDTKRQTEAKFFVEAGPAGELSDEDRWKLSERVRKDEIHAFVEIDADALNELRSSDTPIRFHSESVITGGSGRWFQRVVTQAVQAERMKSAGLDPALVAKATARVPVEVLGLYSKSGSGEIRKADEGGRKAAMFVPIFIMMLMFMTLMMSQTLLQNTLEEKQQKIAEVLLGSVSPFQLMMGKLIGNVGVSVTVVAVYLAGGYWLLDYLHYSHLLPTRLVAWFLVYQVLGVLIFGSIFVAIGAACNELKEAQNYLMPVMLILVFPMMVWFKVLEEPMSRFSTGLSFFPPATPMLMVLRLATAGAMPLWQPILGIVTTLISTIICVWLAGRIFRLGLLMQGKPPKLAELAKWAIRG